MRSVQGLVFAVALVAGACAKQAVGPETGAGSPQQAQVGDTVRLGVGGTARIGTSGVLVAFRGIVADSRCPIDVVCFWMGDAEARLQLSATGAPSLTTMLHSSLEPKSIDYSGLTFRLVDVSPASVSTRRPDPDEYVIALEVKAR